MIKRIFIKMTILLFTISIVFFNGCERDLDILEQATYPTTGEVFDDGFSAGLNYAAFGGSRVDAFQVDTEVKHSGTASMRYDVPDFEDPFGAYAGGSYFTSAARDLSGYDALTFWAKSSQPASIDIIGIGNDLGLSKYLASRSAVSINTNWKKIIIPIPDPSKLVAERGMFFYSEGPEDGSGYTFWIDDMKFEKLGLIAHPRPSILEGQDQIIDAVIGDLLPIGGTYVTFNFPDGTDQRIDSSPAYFEFISSDESVAKVDENGQVSALSNGTAVITAKVGSNNAIGSMTLNVGDPLPGPDQPAPVPTVPASDVISLFSNTYNNVPVDAWATYWEFSTTELKEIQINGNDVKLYTKLNFNGIEFTSQKIDASSMNRFHMDIWTPDPTNLPASFKVLLVDFGNDGNFGGNDDASHELSFTASTNPKLESEKWVSLDVPLSAFTGLTSRKNLAQMVISGDPNTVYVDNVYFYNDGTTPGGNDPTSPAPVPTAAASNVISVYSDSYTSIPGTNLNPDWGQATGFSELDLSGNKSMKYSGLNYQGIELGSSQNVSTMEFLHLDVWTANSSALNVYLISPGPKEAAFSIPVPTTDWLSLEIPLSTFAGVDLQDVIQLKFDGDGDIYLDNIYFYKTSGNSGTAPTVAAPSPTYPAASVVSLYSDAYTNVNVDTWSADWDDAEVADVQIAGNNTKLYTNLVFAGIEFTSQTVNASDMTHFRMDIWTPDPTDSPAIFKIKLVDFGANGSFAGGDDVEHELTFSASTTPALATGSWVSFDIPLSNFTNLVTKGHVAQLIIVGEPLPTVYIDNVLFHK